MKHEGDGDTNCNWCTRNNDLVKKLEDFEILGELKIRTRMETAMVIYPRMHELSQLQIAGDTVLKQNAIFQQTALAVGPKM